MLVSEELDVGQVHLVENVCSVSVKSVPKNKHRDQCSTARWRCSVMFVITETSVDVIRDLQWHLLSQVLRP